MDGISLPTSCLSSRSACLWVWAWERGGICHHCRVQPRSGVVSQPAVGCGCSQARPQATPDRAVPWTGVHQTPLFMEFSRQEYWSGLPFPFSGDLQNSGIGPMSPALLAGSLPPSHQGQVTIRYLNGICKIPNVIRSKHLERKSVMLNLGQVHVFLESSDCAQRFYHCELI